MERETWLPAAPESAAVARALVRAAADQAKLDGDGLWELTLATTEAVANAIDHGQGCGPNGEILLRIEPCDDRLCVEVCDCGRFEWPAGPGGADSVRGRGMPIMEAVTDHMDILLSAGRTRVRLEKQLCPIG